MSAALLLTRSSAAQDSGPVGTAPPQAPISEWAPSDPALVIQAPPARLPHHPLDDKAHLREALPRRLAWEPGEVIPPGYRPITSPDKGLLIAGLVTIGVGCLPAIVTGVIASLAGEGEAFGPMFVPVVGPFITVATAGAEDTGAYLLALDGLAQALGFTLFAVSFAVKDHALSRRFSPSAAVAPEFSAALGKGGASLRVEF